MLVHGYITLRVSNKYKVDNPGPETTTRMRNQHEFKETTRGMGQLSNFTFHDIIAHQRVTEVTAPLDCFANLRSFCIARV